MSDNLSVRITGNEVDGFFCYLQRDGIDTHSAAVLGGKTLRQARGVADGMLIIARKRRDTQAEEIVT